MRQSYDLKHMMCKHENKVELLIVLLKPCDDLSGAGEGQVCSRTVRAAQGVCRPRAPVTGIQTSGNFRV